MHLVCQLIKSLNIVKASSCPQCVGTGIPKPGLQLWWVLFVCFSVDISGVNKYTVPSFFRSGKEPKDCSKCLGQSGQWICRVYWQLTWYLPQNEAAAETRAGK